MTGNEKNNVLESGTAGGRLGAMSQKASEQAGKQKNSEAREMATLAAKLLRAC